MTTKTNIDNARGFAIHAFVFAATMVLLAAIDVAVGGTVWVHWPFLGWGIGLLAHFLFTPGVNPMLARAPAQN